MTDDSTETTEPLTVRLNEESLPEDPDVLAALEDDLGDLLASLLETQYGVDVEPPEVHRGHQYTELDDTCPWCGARLEFNPVRLDPPSGAVSVVECQNDHCTLQGRGLFRLVDLRWNDAGTDRSTVIDGESTPRYRAYRD